VNAQKACPICKKPQVERFRPFCSKRCADIDLSRWFKDSYAIPADERVPDVIDTDEGEDR
jgi:endogenous inhibitor of DNA gyrase (YacG/DUF329 family)